MATSQTTRFSYDTPDNQQAWLWVASLLALIYSMIVFAIRMVVKWKLFGFCDYLLVFAYILSLTCHICIYVGLHFGLGRAPWLIAPSDMQKVSYLIFVTKILTFPTLGLSKASILVFARRLFTPEAKGARSALRYAILFMIVWSIVCPVFLGAGCHPGNLLLAERDMVCTAQVFRMTFAAGVECLTELLVVAMPIYLTLTRDIKREYKTMVCIGFAFRLTILPLGIVYFMSYAWMANSGKNNIGIVPNMILQEMLVCWSLILATTPTLRAFAGRFKTGGLRDILAPERARRQSDVGMATKAAAVIALRSMAVQIRGIAAFSIFDHSKRPDTRNHHTPVRPDIENRHWANIFIRPEDVRSSDESSINDRVPYSQYDMQPREGWEKKRAEQLLSMPHRASLSSIHFVTTAEDYMEEKSE